MHVAPLKVLDLNKKPFMVILTCVSIAWFDHESPLQKHLAKGDNVLGTEWTEKHSMFCTRALARQATLTGSFFFNCAGPKCINAVTLIRLNLAVAKKSTVMGTPRFPGNWDLKDIDVVESLYHRVVEALNGETLMALFNAYSMIFGEEVAHRVARAHSFACPPW